MPGFIFTTLSYIVGAFTFYVFSKGRGLTKTQSAWLLFAALAGGILGAKLTRFCFAAASGISLESFIAHPDGRTIVGGVIFGWVAVEICKKRLSIKRSTGDAFALALALGESIGRIGCYFNQCCYGAPVSSLSWAVFQAGTLRHPAQIYSALTAFSIFLLLLFLRTKVKYEGDLFRLYIVLWGSSRFFLEFVRERTDMHFGLSMAQWVCLEMVLAMLIGSVWMYNRAVRCAAGKTKEVKESAGSKSEP